MECFRAFRQVGEVSFLQGFCEGVEQAPDVPGTEFLVPWLPPFSEHGWNQSVGTHANVRRPDDQVVRCGVVQAFFLVNANPPVLVMPLLQQLAHGSAHQLGQIPDNKASMFPRQLHLTGEREIVADKNRCAGSNSGRECFVVTVAQAQHPAVIVAACFPALDFHQAEIPGAIVRQAVGIRRNREIVCRERLFDTVNQLQVRNGSPCCGGARRGNGFHVLAFYKVGPAMEDEIWMFTLCRWFKQLDHGDSPFCFESLIRGMELMFIRQRDHDVFFEMEQAGHSLWSTRPLFPSPELIRFSRSGVFRGWSAPTGLPSRRSSGPAALVSAYR